MVQIVLSSSSLPVNTESQVSPCIIESGANVTVPYNYYDSIYGRAVYTIPSFTFPDYNANRKMRLKSFRGTFLELTNEKYYNNEIILHNLTSNTKFAFQMPPALYNDITTYAADLTTVCDANAGADGLTFEYVDPTTNPQNDGIKTAKCKITNKNAGEEWRLFFSRRSFNRSLGFDLGFTPICPAGGSLISNTPFTITSIGRIYMSLQIGTKSFTNAVVSTSYIVYVSGPSLENTPAKSLSFNESSDFPQHIDINTSQFNQLVVSLYDEFGNIIYLNGHYSLILEIE